MTDPTTPAIPWRTYGRPGFQSCKTTGPVFYSGRWPRDALVQATLDASIHSITQVAPPTGLDDAELALEIDRGHAKELRAYCRNSSGNLPIPQGCDSAVAVPRFEVMQPSTLLVTRMIWKMRSYSVDAGTVMAIRSVLLANGGNVTLLQLTEASTVDKRHITNSALSLVCHGHLELAEIRELNEQTRLILPKARQLPSSENVAIS